MKELEKILEEIDLKITGSIGKRREGLLEAEKIIHKHLSHENTTEITRCSRDNDGWIPVEERLPEEAGTYIVNALTGERSIVTFAKWQNRYKRFDMSGARAYWRVIAWRPLPEPYRPERSEK